MKHTPLVNFYLPGEVRRINNITIMYEKGGNTGYWQQELYRAEILQEINPYAGNIMLCQVHPEEKKKKQFVSLRLHGVKEVNKNG